jgi:hypothetical protein
VSQPAQSDAQTCVLINYLARAMAENDEMLPKLCDGLPDPGYALPMLFNCAEFHGNGAVDRLAPFGFADFSAIFRDVIAAAHLIMVRRATAKPFKLYLETSPELDSSVEDLFLVEHAQTAFLNEKLAIEARRLLVTRVDDGYQISIAKSRRRSALTLLRDKAMTEALPRQIRKVIRSMPRVQIINDEAERKIVTLTLMTALEDLAPLRKGLPAAWARMLGQLGVNENELLSFLAFTLGLRNNSLCWYKADHLFSQLSSFCQFYKRQQMARPQFDALMALLSSDISEAKAAGFVTPFLRIGEWYRYWFFAYHVLLPAFAFVSALQRKYADLWSRTFGSDMALVADYIASQLPAHPDVAIVTRRGKKGLGDIDLVLFNKKSNQLLLCELKTVFDKFRTDFQSTNFTLQRVNFDKAILQLQTAAAAIADGRWPLREILPNFNFVAPPKVFKLILLWRDHPNPTLDTATYIPVVDFSSFIYLAKECKFQLGELVEAIEQLAKIYMASIFTDDFFIPLGDEKLKIQREGEIGALPPLEFIRGLAISELALRECSSLTHLPEDWKAQAEHEEPRPLSFTTDLPFKARDSSL